MLMSDLQTWLDGCTQTHRRIEQALQGLTDALARRPALLPDWTVGHVVTHMARNADSHTRMVEAAQRGEAVTQYAGGQPEREAAIAAGQGRPAAELLADLTSAHQRVESAWAAASDEVWATGLRRVASGFNTIAWAVFQRWREAEVHFADLGLPELGAPASWDALSPAYVEAELDELIPSLHRRVPEGEAVLLVAGDRPSRVYGTGDKPVEIRASAGRTLQYLMGRGGDLAWPALPSWQ
jgi:maleylpyruvate isomerase